MTALPNRRVMENSGYTKIQHTAQKSAQGRGAVRSPLLESVNFSKA